MSKVLKLLFCIEYVKFLVIKGKMIMNLETFPDVLSFEFERNWAVVSIVRKIVYDAINIYVDC